MFAQQLPDYDTPDGYKPLVRGQWVGNEHAVVQQIGSGTFSTVWHAYNITSGKHVALKILQRRHNRLGEFEYLLSTNVNHTHLMPLKARFHTRDNHTVLVFPLLRPLDTLERVNARRLITHVLLALRYVHEEWHMVHTDVKWDNVLYDTRRKRFMLADLGLAEFAPVEKRNRTDFSLQTTGYRAPEVEDAAHTSVSYPVDVWGAARVLEKALGDRKRSDALQDFMRHALDVNPETRWNATQLLRHEWLIEL